jgi:hypothetical protein
VILLSILNQFMKPQRRRQSKTTFSLQAFGHSLATPPPVRAGHLTADGRRALFETIPIAHGQSLPAAHSESLDSTNTDDIDDNNWLDVPDTHLPDAEATTRPKRKRKWYTTTVSLYSKNGPMDMLTNSSPRMPTYATG